MQFRSWNLWKSERTPEGTLAAEVDRLSSDPRVHRVFDWFSRHEREIAEFQMAITGQHPGNEERIVEGTAAIVSACAKTFGGFPFKRYLFLLTFSPGLRGGLEHRDSTSLLADPHQLERAEGYWDLFTLIAHEFFHVWNVKRLRDLLYKHADETYSLEAWRHQQALAIDEASHGPDHPDVAKIRRQIDALRSEVNRASKETAQLKSQIIDMRANLETAEKTYGPEHPDVVSMRNQLKKLEDQLTTAKPDALNSDDIVVPDADNPTYLEFAAQLHAAQEQRKTLLSQRKDLQAQLEKYQKALIENPEAQKEMAALSRDYENAQVRYRELKEKKMAADMGEQIQKDRTGERLTLIDHPALPIGTHPPRIVFFIAGALLSLMGGLAAVALAQIVSQSVVGVRHLESLVGMAPLVAVPHVYTQEERETSFLLDPEILGVLKWCGARFLAVYERVDPRRERFTKCRDRIRQRLGLGVKREDDPSPL